MKVLVKRLESLLELGGIKKDIIFLIISGAAVLLSLLDVRPFPFDMAWIAIILCDSRALRRRLLVWSPPSI